MKFERATTFIAYLAVWLCFGVLLLIIYRMIVVAVFSESPEQMKQREYMQCYDRCTEKMKESDPTFNDMRDTRCLQRCIYHYKDAQES